MKIKKLELVGFKSFVDRTVLHFDHDVLGIVGPNGCGKSNIVDAIRWCMGEQSARHLRGRSMEDVIFSGSESRAPHDFAEVTLTFENDDPQDDAARVQGVRRDRRHAPPAPHGRERVPHQQDAGAPARRDRPVPGHGRRHQGVLHRRAGQDRPHRERQARGPAPAHRGGRGHHQVQEPEEAGREEDGAHAAEPAARGRHRRRDRPQPRVAQAPGGQGRAVRRLPQRARGPAAPRGFAQVPRARRLDQARGRRGRAARARQAEASRGELAVRARPSSRSRASRCTPPRRRSTRRTNASFAADSAVRAEEAAIERAKDRLAALAPREQQAAGREARDGRAGSRASARSATSSRSRSGPSSKKRRAQATAGAPRRRRSSRSSRRRTARPTRASRSRRQAIAQAQAAIASARGQARRLRASTGGDARAPARSVALRARVASRARAVEHGGAGRGAGAVDRGSRARASVTTAEEKARLEQRLGELKERIADAGAGARGEPRASCRSKRSRHGALDEMHARLEGVGAGTKALVRTKRRLHRRARGRPHRGTGRADAGARGPPGLHASQDVVVSDVERGLELLEELARGKKGRATIVSAACALRGRGARAARRRMRGVVARLCDALRFAPEDEALVHALVGDALVVRDLATRAPPARRRACAPRS